MPRRKLKIVHDPNRKPMLRFKAPEFSVEDTNIEELRRKVRERIARLRAEKRDTSSGI